jgi:electron transfer flavoprotein alpha/beta subunit
MKRIFAITLFAASSLAAAGNLSAQNHQMKANIPFAFTLGSKTLPAGRYTISSPLPDVVTVRNDQNRMTAASAVYGSDKQSANSVLVFHRYGNQYFLEEILGPNAMNVSVPRCQREQNAQRQEAALREGTETLVALK